MTAYTHTEDYVIERVDRHDDSITIETTRSTGFGVSRDRVGRDVWERFTPEPGDEITLYLRNGSYTVGLDWKGKRVFLCTEEEIEAEHAFSSARRDRQKAEELEWNREAMDADYDALPQVFKARIDRFRTNNPDFRRDYETYEMFVCKEAVVLAEKSREAVASGEHADEVEAFWADPAKIKLAGYDVSEDGPPAIPELRWLFWAVSLNSKAYDYDYEREKAVTGLSDGHSGNTHGTAVSLARLYIQAPEYVSQKHGALSPLVGSEAYGDVPVGAES